VYSKEISSALPDCISAWRASATRGSNGFTLIEVMIVVAIVAVLAAIALPNYADYVKRGKIIEATSALSDLRTRYEQYYLDNRTYVGGCADANGKIRQLAQAGTKSFTIACNTGESATAYLGTATGNATEGMASFVYSINQDNVHATTGTSWGPTNATCWVIRKDGSCS
jgi:type IV pilus assembly protein PilE